MGKLFWLFIFYSFLGFLLEVGFTALTHGGKRDRKCLLALPLCPVYGLGVLLILALVKSGSWARDIVSGF